jgi:histidyl-tRNA synthetase
MKPTLPQGTRDFGADTLRKRKFIFSVLQEVFELYGFQPLETPAMENLETLLGKYGDEGDKLIFKILNNGLDLPSKKEKVLSEFEKIQHGKNSAFITERALRYDLTIPFARYVAMNSNQIAFPYRRYQMQPVWRADRPQKGRYREFYQCDADLVGSNSLLSDVEFAHIYADAFERLHLPVEIRINNRKILAALAEACGSNEQLVPITVAIDKLDKIGLEKVKEELKEGGLEEQQIELIEKYLSIHGSNEDKLAAMEKIIGHTETGRKGIGELEFVIRMSGIEGIVSDFTLARGLNYYTGTIYEVKARGVEMGSIGGGGRYDDLTGLFGLPNMAGVGISFGVDRIYDVLEEMNLFPEGIYTGTRVLFFNLGELESARAFVLLQALRKKGISGELYHETAKFDKQFKYADKKRIPIVVIIGSKELADGSCTLKMLDSGQQVSIRQEELANHLDNFPANYNMPS